MSDGGPVDCHIAYQVFGDGPIDLVFCPEWFNNIDMWWSEPRVERFLARLASFSRVIVFDKRGTGVSDPVPLDRDPVLETWMDDILRVMDYTGSKNATLFGHSGGGQVCLLFAATHPERTRSLVLSNAWARLARRGGILGKLPELAVLASRPDRQVHDVDDQRQLRILRADVPDR